jgi:hypothetical protein
VVSGSQTLYLSALLRAGFHRQFKRLGFEPSFYKLKFLYILNVIERKRYRVIIKSHLADNTCNASESREDESRRFPVQMKI